MNPTERLRDSIIAATRDREVRQIGLTADDASRSIGGLFGDAHAEAAAAFVGVCPRDPTLQLLITREPDVDRWARYLEHEGKRASSRWNGKECSDLAEVLRHWAAHPDQDPLVTEVDKRLTAAGVAPLCVGEQVGLALAGLRRAVWRLAREKEKKAS